MRATAVNPESLQDLRCILEFLSAGEPQSQNLNFKSFCKYEIIIVIRIKSFFVTPVPFKLLKRFRCLFAACGSVESSFNFSVFIFRRVR